MNNIIIYLNPNPIFSNTVFLSYNRCIKSTGKKLQQHLNRKKIIGTCFTLKLLLNAIVIFEHHGTVFTFMNYFYISVILCCKGIYKSKY